MCLQGIARSQPSARSRRCRFQTGGPARFTHGLKHQIEVGLMGPATTPACRCWPQFSSLVVAERRAAVGESQVWSCLFSVFSSCLHVCGGSGFGGCGSMRQRSLLMPRTADSGQLDLVEVFGRAQEEMLAQLSGKSATTVKVTLRKPGNATGLVRSRLPVQTTSRIQHHVRGFRRFFPLVFARHAVRRPRPDPPSGGSAPILAASNA
jgi:hypothetical protein